VNNHQALENQLKDEGLTELDPEEFYLLEDLDGDWEDDDFRPYYEPLVLAFPRNCGRRDCWNLAALGSIYCAAHLVSLAGDIRKELEG
jgi:hypothetical protein